MGRVLYKLNHKREQGKLYYCGTDKEGNLTVCEAIMNRTGKKKAKK